MTTIDIAGFAGAGSNQSWTGGGLYSWFGAPVARQAYNGLRPIIIVDLGLYVSGRYNQLPIRFHLMTGEGAYAESGLFNIPQQYPSSTRRHAGFYLPMANAAGSGTSIRVGYTPASGDLVTMGRHGTNTDIRSVNGDGIVYGGNVLAGQLSYVEVPTQPLSPAASQIAPGMVRVTWAAPADFGGTDLTGFIVQYSRDPNWNPANVTQLTVPAGYRQADIQGLALGTWHFRVVATNAVTAAYGTGSLPSDYRTVTLISTDPGNLDGWTRFGAMPAGMQENTTAGLRRATVYDLIDYPAVDAILKENFLVSGTATLDADVHGMKRTITGLKPGTVYRLRASGSWLGSVGDPGASTIYQMGVIGIGYSDARDFGYTHRVQEFPAFEFVATATTHEMTFRLHESVTRGAPVEMENFAFFGITLEEIPSSSPYRLQSIAYESSLINHFDLACNSTGARWWVDRAGITQFVSELGAGPLLATFTDQRAAGKLEYVDIRTSYDTRNIVNDLNVEQHGAVLGEDGWEANDYTANFKELTSIATWGPRSDDVDISLYDEGPYAGSVASRAADLIADDAGLGMKVTGIRWNAWENPELVANLEIYGLVDVEFRGKTYHCRIVHIKHNVQPKRWMIDLELIEG